MNWTEKDYDEYLKGKKPKVKIQMPKKSKYGNKKTKVDGILFDSKKEADYYCDLMYLKKAGEVTKIELQPKYLLQEGFTKNGKKHQEINYIADFKVTYSDGKVEIIDVKGKRTEVFNIKLKLFEYRYKDLELKIV